MKFLKHLFSSGGTVERSERDRRAPVERRQRTVGVTYSARKFERRLYREKRKGWERVSRWSSAPMD